MTTKEVFALVATWPPEQRRELLMGIRAEMVLHPLEDKLGVKAETILEAIARAPDLTIRGIKGIIAEAVFSTEMLPVLLKTPWRDITPPPDEDRPYDSLVTNGTAQVRVQVKNQRMEKGKPKTRGGTYVVETQKTRSGKDEEGNDTRPYYVREFDLLAVCLWPSSGNWQRFMYCRMDRLAVRPEAKTQLQVFQYIPFEETSDWSFDLMTALGSFK
jgi:hypothetical protein